MLLWKTLAQPLRATPCTLVGHTLLRDFQERSRELLWERRLYKSAAYKSVPQRVECPTRVFHESVPQECRLQECPTLGCPTRARKNVPQEPPTRVSRETTRVSPTRVSRKSAPQEFSMRVPHKNLQEFSTRVFYTCYKSVSYKSVPQECLLQEWLMCAPQDRLFSSARGHSESWALFFCAHA